MTEIINPMKKQLVYAEGKLAFAGGMRRRSNPYRNIHIELASSWWQGCDTAEEESHTDQRNSEVCMTAD